MPYVCYTHLIIQIYKFMLLINMQTDLICEVSMVVVVVAGEKVYNASVSVTVYCKVRFAS